MTKSTWEPLAAALFHEILSFAMLSQCSPMISCFWLWFQFLARSALVSVFMESNLRPPVMQPAHSIVNAQLFPVLKVPLKNTALSISAYLSVFIPFCLYLSYLYVIFTHAKKRKVIHTLIEGEWDFSLSLDRFLFLPPPALHILSSPSLSCCKYL